MFAKHYVINFLQFGFQFRRNFQEGKKAHVSPDALLETWFKFMQIGAADNYVAGQNKNHSTDNVQPIYQVTCESLLRLVRISAMGFHSARSATNSKIRAVDIVGGSISGCEVMSISTITPSINGPVYHC